MCERVSSVEPDFDEVTKSVRPSSIDCSSSRIACGCVVSRTWKLSTRNVRRSTSGARLAYEHFQQQFAGRRWEFLASKGAWPQRCLWASTSTKNPDYRDVLYVEELIGPQTVDTMPEETIKAFQDHGVVRGDTVAEDAGEAHALLDAIAAVGVDYDDVTLTLELEGVQKFADSFEELLAGVRAKRGELAAV